MASCSGPRWTRCTTKSSSRTRTYNFVAGAARFSGRVAQVVPPRRASRLTPTCSTSALPPTACPCTWASATCPRALQPLVAGRLGGSHYFSRTTKAVMADFIQDPKLASVLCGQWGDYGLPPAQSSFAMHAVVAQHYLGGASFPIGGASQIAHHIEPVISAGVVRWWSVPRSSKSWWRATAPLACAWPMAMKFCATTSSAPRACITPTASCCPTPWARRLKHARTSWPRSSRLCRTSGSTLASRQCATDLGLQQANRWVYRDYDHDASLRKAMATFLKQAQHRLPAELHLVPLQQRPGVGQPLPRQVHHRRDLAGAL
jgi:all-trans-retinol 13,14-reductase